MIIPLLLFGSFMQIVHAIRIVHVGLSDNLNKIIKIPLHYIFILFFDDFGTFAITSSSHLSCNINFDFLLAKLSLILVGCHGQEINNLFIIFCSGYILLMLYFCWVSQVRNLIFTWKQWLWEHLIVFKYFCPCSARKIDFHQVK